MGKLIFRYGTMNSGKSLNLLSVNYNYNQNDVNVLIMKPHEDTRDMGEIGTRLAKDLSVPAYTFVKDDNLIQKYNDISSSTSKSYDVLLVDEAQFVTTAQARQLGYIAYVLDVMVICYGLKIDFKAEPFAGSAMLMAMAGNIEEMKTICQNCGKHKAIFHLLYLNDKLVEDFETNVVIDGQENVKYSQVCGKCYYKLTGKNPI